MNVNGEVLKLKGDNLKFISKGPVPTYDATNPLNGQSSESNRPKPVVIEKVPDLFSFDSNSPLHHSTSNVSNDNSDDLMFNHSNNSNSLNNNSGTTPGGMKTGNDRAAAVKSRYEAMRQEQIAKGVLEWDPVEERYREKVKTC